MHSHMYMAADLMFHGGKLVIDPDEDRSDGGIIAIKTKILQTNRLNSI